MAAARFVEQLNVQIANELAAHNQYLACAVYYDALTMPQMAAFFYGQALEERDHAMMMVQYLIDTDHDVVIPGVDAPVPSFDDVVAPVTLALAQEKRVTEQINALLKTAREESDFASEQFMQWFIKEQVEEVATMSDLLAVVTRNRTDIEDIEEYVAREQRAGDADPTAPRIAGACPVRRRRQTGPHARDGGRSRRGRPDLCRPAARGGPPCRRPGPRPAPGDDVGGGRGDLVPVPRLPVRRRARLVRPLVRGVRRAGGGRRRRRDHAQRHRGVRGSAGRAVVAFGRPGSGPPLRLTEMLSA